PLRVRRGDVHGDVTDELAELLGARHEVGFAIHLEEHADLSFAMDVGSDRAFFRRAAGLLRGRGDALLAKVLDGLFEVARGFHERLLAVHHAGAGFLPELFYCGCGDFHFRYSSYFLSALSALSAPSAPSSVDSASWASRSASSIPLRSMSPSKRE